jgi:hypothetical protein
MCNRIMSSSITRKRFSSFVVAVVCALLLPLIGCGVCAGQPPMLAAVDTQGLSLIEIGSFFKVRTLRFAASRFETCAIPQFSVVVGVSRSGKLLLLAKYSGRHGSAIHATDQIDVLTLTGDVVASFEPDAQALGVFFAELSPDEQYIAYVGALPNPVRYGIHLISKTGYARTVVSMAEPQLPESIAWSPDGREIVYDSNGHIFIINVATQTITSLGSGASPNWSPDGNTIAYRTLEGSIALLDPNHVRYGELADVHPVRGIRWSPDSRYILFTDRGTGAISVVEPLTGKTAVVAHGVEGEDESRLRWVVGWPPAILREH